MVRDKQAILQELLVLRCKRGSGRRLRNSFASRRDGSVLCPSARCDRRGRLGRHAGDLAEGVQRNPITELAGPFGDLAVSGQPLCGAE